MGAHDSIHVESIPGLKEQLWGNIDKRGPNECWPWTGKINPYSGRGYLCRRVVENGITKDVNFLAYRLVYRFENGDVPTKKFVCHTCDNPACCNPVHLYVGTQKDNMRDMVRRKRSLVGVKNPGSKLTVKQVLKIKSMRYDGESSISVGKKFGITSSVVRKIWDGSSWGWLDSSLTEIPEKVDSWTLRWLADEYEKSATFLLKKQSGEDDELLVQRSNNEAVKLRNLAEYLEGRKEDIWDFDEESV